MTDSMFPPGAGSQGASSSSKPMPPGDHRTRWALGTELLGADGEERIVLLERRYLVTCETCGSKIALIRDQAAAALVGTSRCRRCSASGHPGA